MALPDNFVQGYSTPVVWGEAGASGVTNTLTFEALPAGSARAGAEKDLGATHPPRVKVEPRIESGTAPTAGGTYDIYLSWSEDGTTYPGGVTGADEAWPADGNEDEWVKQLEFIGSLVVTNDGNAVQVGGPWIVYVKGRYVVPVVDNNTDQAVRDEATATDNQSRIILTPLDDQVED